jgi:hypothetical protein
VGSSADPQHHLDRAAVDRGIGKVTAVAAAHPGCGLPAPGAVRRAGTDSGRRPDTAGPMSDIVEHDVVEVRQQPGDKITWLAIIQPGHSMIE